MRVDRNYAISSEVYNKIEKYKIIKNMSRNQFLNEVIERGLELDTDRITKELIDIALARLFQRINKG